MGLKTCTRCAVPLTLDQFSPRGDSQGGLRSQCKACVARVNLNRYHTRPATREAHKLASRRSLVKRRYGLSPTEYAEVVGDGHCMACDAPPPDGSVHCVDHDHSTGEVRGLLCRDCNLCLGYARDNPTTLTRLASYLTK